MKIFKSSVTGIIILFVIAALATATMTIKQNMTDLVINDNITQAAKNVKYKTPVAAGDDLFRESGIEIAEADMKKIHGELKKQFPGYEVDLRKNLKNSELIDAVYMSLSDGMPVLCLIASPDDTSDPPAWRVACGLVVEMDIFGDKIAVSELGGSAETYSVRNFLKATRFECYENMGLFLKLQFALEIFSKNTVFILEKKPLS